MVWQAVAAALAPTVINGLFGGKSKTQETKQEPWAPQQPYLRDIYQQAKNRYTQGPQQYYPESTVGPQSDATQAAIAGLSDFPGGEYNQFLQQGAKDAITALGYGQRIHCNLEGI